MKPEAAAEKTRQNANTILKSASAGIREADKKINAIADLENVTEQIANTLIRGHENCRREQERVSELSREILDDVPKYLAASGEKNADGAEEILERITEANSEIELCLERVRGFQRRIDTLTERIERTPIPSPQG